MGTNSECDLCDIRQHISGWPVFAPSLICLVITSAYANIIAINVAVMRQQGAAFEASCPLQKTLIMSWMNLMCVCMCVCSTNRYK